MAKYFELGEEIHDIVTGIKGIAIARIEYLNGCVQYSIKQKADKDGKDIEGVWVDSQQIEKTGEGIVEVVEHLSEASGTKIEASETGGYSKEAPRL